VKSEKGILFSALLFRFCVLFVDKTLSQLITAVVQVRGKK